jgi:hypothetical protein
MKTPTVLLIAAHDDPADAPRIARQVDGADVHVVVPAGAVPGERWIADRDERAAHAARRLAAWVEMLAPHARRVTGELGDPSPTLAEADARAVVRPDRVIAVGPPPRSRQRARRSRRRVAAAALYAR